MVGTDGQGDSYIPPQTLFAGGIITYNRQVLELCYCRDIYLAFVVATIIEQGQTYENTTCSMHWSKILLALLP
jgi:hypothetical protein